MTIFSGAKDKKVFDGNTILVEIGKEKNKHKYVYIAGDGVYSFLTDDKICEYVSNTGNNLCPYSVATSLENYYLLSRNFSFFKKDKIDYDTILDGIYVPDSGLLFEEVELCKNNSTYDNLERQILTSKYQD